MDMYNNWYQPISDDIVSRARQIKLLICDIDGVFSDGSIYMGNDGEELKTFNTKDGFGVKALMNAGVDVAVITGRSSNIVSKRMKSLGVTHLYQGMENKLQGYNELLQDLQLTAEQVAYIGDDFPDIPVMKVAGLAVAVGDAHPYAKQVAHLITTCDGGRGAVRELTDLLVIAQKGEAHLIEHLEGFSK